MAIKRDYEGYETIDWVKDVMKEQSRKTRLMKGHTWGWKAYAYTLYEASQSWILILVVGIGIGILASCIAVVAAWLTDIREGYCKNEWYLSKNICCTGYDKEACNHWIDWSYSFFRVPGVFVINWVFYVFFSVRDCVFFLSSIYNFFTKTLLAATAAVLVVNLAPFAAGSGTAEVKTILGGFIIRGFLGLRTMIIKATALPLTVASGLAVGKEGPMIHLASCVGNIFQRFFSKYHDNEAHKREILSAASAAGVAVAFGSPIGGVLFSLEELSSFFPAKTMLRSFFCALVSCVTLQFVDPFRGKRVLFQVSYSRNWHIFETPFFLLLGVFGGLSGAFFVKMSHYAQHYRQLLSTKDKPILEVAVIAAGTAVICYLNGFTRVDSSELLEFLFKECSESDFNGLCDKSLRGWTILSLMTALVFRLCLTIISISIKVPAGIFIPSMVWGALFGRIVGIMVQASQEQHPEWAFFGECHPDELCVTPGMYALLGAIGALGGVTRLTVSLTVVMFELTGTLNYIIPCMVTLMVAKLVGDTFGKGGVTDVQIQRKQLPFLDGTEDMIVGSPAFEPMTPVEELLMLRVEGMTVGEVEQIIAETDYKGFPVVSDLAERIFIGYITRGDIKQALALVKGNEYIQDETKISFQPDLQKHPRLGDEFDHYPDLRDGVVVLSSYLNRSPFSVHPNVQVELVMDMFKKLGPRYIVVLDDSRLEGFITKKDLLAALHESEHSENNAVPIRRRSRASTESDAMALVEIDSDMDLSRRQSESSSTSESRSLLGLFKGSSRHVLNKVNRGGQ